MVSAYCGAAALSLLLIQKKEEGRRDCIIRNIVIFFFMFFAVNIRSKVGYLTLGSAAFAICLEIIRYLLKAADRQKIKKAAVSFIVICAAAGLSISTHKIHESRNGWEDFREYHAERARFTITHRWIIRPIRNCFNRSDGQRIFISCLGNGFLWTRRSIQRLFR